MPIETSKETEDAKKAREAKEKKDRDDQDQAAKDKKKEEVTVQNSWTGFIKSLFTYFVLTLIFGLFGSSFIYLTSRGSELDEIFPTDEMFYSAKSYEILKHGPENIVDCKETSTGSFMGMEDNFPYNLIKIKSN